MAFKLKKITNSKTGQTYLFLQTAADSQGKILEIESGFAPHSLEPPLHYHPYQFEDFTILEGELTVKINGSLKILKRGDTLHIPANTHHSMWNNSAAKTTVNWKIRPALNSEQLFETFAGLANDNKTKPDGIPSFLQVVLTVNKFSDSSRLVKPPYFIQKLLFSLLTPVSLLLGYRAVYKKYLD